MMKWVLLIATVTGGNTDTHYGIHPSLEECQRAGEYAARLYEKNVGTIIGNLTCVPYKEEDVRRFHFGVNGDWR